VIAAQRRMAPGVAEADAAEALAPRPDRAEPFEQRDQDLARGQHAVRGARGQEVEQAAGARTIVAREQLRRGPDALSERGEERCSPGDTDEWVGLAYLEPSSEASGREPCQRLAVGAQRLGGPCRERARREHVEAPDGETLRAGELV